MNIAATLALMMSENRTVKYNGIELVLHVMDFDDDVIVAREGVRIGKIMKVAKGFKIRTGRYSGEGRTYPLIYKSERAAIIALLERAK